MGQLTDELCRDKHQTGQLTGELAGDILGNESKCPAPMGMQ
ncbi:hypothetical protein A2U01_0081848, partial [Trifolium medium]|nr:hypothetical protein [Trifolium medium]